MTTSEPFETTSLDVSPDTLKAIEIQLDALGPLLEKTSDGLLVLAPDTPFPRIVFANGALCRMAGSPQRELRGRSLDELVLEGSDNRMKQQVLVGLAYSGTTRLLRPDGSTTDVDLSLIPVPVDETGISHWIGLVRPMPSAPAEQSIRSNHDELTGLPNRAYLLQSVGGVIERSLRTESSFALLVLDIDRFREVNESFGHDAGDLMLSTAAERLLEVVRQTDVVARLSGDEFGILLGGVGDESNAEFVATKIAKALEQPFDVAKGSPLSINTSVGIAMYPKHGREVTELIRSADIAMYEAKRTGRRISVYSPAHEPDTADRLALETELRNAFEQGQMLQYYQAILDLGTGRIEKAEALVRWNHPERGILSPAAFLPVAESSGLMLKVATFCLDDALRQRKEWAENGFHVNISMNLSPSVLRDAEISEVLSELLDKWETPPNGLEVEIIESAIVKDPVQATAVLSLIQALGIPLALDDFGTGYSSLSNLREIPFQQIKIDKSFVSNMLDETGDAAIVRALIDLGHALGRKVVAEGIEDLATLRKLREWGCDYGQGYFISRPIPAEDFAEFVRKRTI
jgi:diguanylate cyclase (GGDEF)-like protein/PAS domain S-box-containing protein